MDHTLFTLLINTVSSGAWYHSIPPLFDLMCLFAGTLMVVRKPVFQTGVLETQLTYVVLDLLLLTVETLIIGGTG